MEQRFDALIKLLRTYLDPDMPGIDKIIEFVSLCLRSTPLSFWTAAASSSGKYHPSFSLEDGGLVRHTAITMYWADRWSHYFRLDTQDRAAVIVAACLHDTYKGGLDDEWEHTLNNHAKIACQQILRAGAEQSLQSSEFVWTVADAVRTHMSQWSMPRSCPAANLSVIQLCVSLADYAAAQKIYDETDVLFEDLR